MLKIKEEIHILSKGFRILLLLLQLLSIAVIQ